MLSEMSDFLPNTEALALSEQKISTEVFLIFLKHWQ